MKLLIAADIFPPEAGGPATYAVALANALMDQGDEVVIVSLNPDSDKKVVNCKLSAVRHKNKFLRYAEYLWLLCKEAKDIDVIYAMGPVNSGLSALIAAWLRRRRLVVKVVGDYAWEQGYQRFGVKDLIGDFQKRNDYKFQVIFLKWIESFVCRKADKVIVPSKYLKGIVEGWGAKNVEVVHNSVEFESVSPKKKSEDERWIVSVGRLVPWKGMDTLIEIMPNLLKESPGLKLKIVGDGPDLESLKSKVISYKLENVVELTGKLSKEETLSYIAAADVFVLNSAYEGLSHVLLEAMFSEVSVLASDCGGNSELLDSNFLFDYNDEEVIIQKVTQVLRGKISKKNKFDEIQFRFENMIKKTKDVLCNV